jgi:hypothetical protein
MHSALWISACRSLMGGWLVIIAVPLAAQETRTTTTRPTTTDTRQAAPAPVISPVPAPPPAPSFLIPGGATSAAMTPLWIKATKLICETQTDDGSPNDEAYAIVASIALNWDKLWESKVRVVRTNIYEGMNSGDYRAVNLPVWGFEDAGMPIRTPNDAIILATIYEHDNANVFLTTKLLEGLLIAKVGTLHPGYTYAQLNDMFFELMRNTLLVNLHQVGDDPLTPYGVLRVPLLAEELHAAQSGTIVKKPVTALDMEGGGGRGKYTLRLQIGKQGVTSVAW